MDREENVSDKVETALQLILSLIRGLEPTGKLIVLINALALTMIEHCGDYDQATFNLDTTNRELRRCLDINWVRLRKDAQDNIN